MPYFAGHPSGYLYQDIVLNDFSKGRVNTPQVLGIAQLVNGQSPNMYNVDTAGRSIRKMAGFVKVTPDATTGDVSSLWFDFLDSRIYSGYGTKFGFLSGNALTDVGTGFTDGAIWSFSRLNDYIVTFNNGPDTPKLYNSVSATLGNITTPPATWGGSTYPKFGVNWMGRIFAPIGDILYYCKLYDPTDWTPGVAATSGGALTIGADGIPIKACIPLANGLLIVKGPGLYYLGGNFTNADFDQTQFNWNLLSTIVDAIGWNAAVAISDTVYIWGHDFVWLLTGTQDLQRISVDTISANIQYDVGNVVGPYDAVCGVVYPDRHQIWWNVAKDSSSTAIDTVYIYDYENKQWMLRTGYSHKCQANIYDSNGNIQIYSGGYSPNGYIYQQNVGVDYDGAAMACYYETDWFSLVGLPEGKPMLGVISLGPQTNTTIQYSYQYDYLTSNYDSQLLNASTVTSDWHTAGSGTGSTWGGATSEAWEDVATNWESILTDWESPVTSGGVGSTTGTWQSASPGVQVIWLYGYGRRMQHRFYSNAVGANFDILEIKHPVSTIGYR